MAAPRQGETLYGLLAEFEQASALIEAVGKARAAGYRRLGAYTPFPLEGLAEALELKPSRVPLFTLLGGLAGGCGAYFMMWYASVESYPLDVGGRPLHSWPAFIPITFELTVLGAAFAAFLGMLALNGLPHPYHPLFNVPAFKLASRDRFFLCIQSVDPLFDAGSTRRFLEELGGAVYEVEP